MDQSVLYYRQSDCQRINSGSQYYTQTKKKPNEKKDK